MTKTHYKMWKTTCYCNKFFGFWRPCKSMICKNARYTVSTWWGEIASKKESSKWGKWPKRKGTGWAWIFQVLTQDEQSAFIPLDGSEILSACVLFVIEIRHKCLVVPIGRCMLDTPPFLVCKCAFLCNNRMTNDYKQVHWPHKINCSHPSMQNISKWHISSSWWIW